MSNVNAPVRVGDPLYFVLPDERVVCAKVTNIVPSRGRRRWAALAADDRMSYSTRDLPYFFTRMRAEGYVMERRLARALGKHPYLASNKEGALLPWIAEHLIEEGVLCPPFADRTDGLCRLCGRWQAGDRGMDGARHELS